MGKAYFTWGEIKKAMKKAGVSDDMRIGVMCVIPKEDKDMMHINDEGSAVGGTITDIRMVGRVSNGNIEIEEVTLQHGRLR